LPTKANITLREINMLSLRRKLRRAALAAFVILSGATLTSAISAPAQAGPDDDQMIFIFIDT
jgi:hypothetical protein